MEVIAAQTAGHAIEWQWLVLVIGLLVFGVLLLGVEAFLTPGFGVGGVLGLLLILGGSVGSWIVLGSTWGALVIVITVAVSVVMFVVGLRSKAARKRLVLETEQPRGGGVETSDLEHLVGAQGTAKTDLRPAGIVLIGEERVDVVSEGGFVEAGERVKVLAVDGPRIIVARAE